MKLVTGNSNLALARAISDYLELPLTDATVRRFADKEIFVEINENVRGEDVFILQSTSFPANDNLMELLILSDALRRSSARRITAVIPYFGYARQDRKSAPRTPISAKLVANLIVESGIHRVLTLDLHAGQIQGFFDIPTDNLYAAPTMVRDIRDHYDARKHCHRLARRRWRGSAPATSPAGSAYRWPSSTSAGPRPGVSEVMNIIGDVAGHACLLIDDIVDSGGTLVNAAEALLAAGATSVSAYITHGVLSGEAATRIGRSRLKELVITDSIEASEPVAQTANIRVMSIAPLIGEAIARTAAEQIGVEPVRLSARLTPGATTGLRQREPARDEESPSGNRNGLRARFRPSRFPEQGDQPRHESGGHRDGIELVPQLRPLLRRRRRLDLRFELRRQRLHLLEPRLEVLGQLIHRHRFELQGTADDEIVRRQVVVVGTDAGKDHLAGQRAGVEETCHAEGALGVPLVARQGAVAIEVGTGEQAGNRHRIVGGARLGCGIAKALRIEKAVEDLRTESRLGQFIAAEPAVAVGVVSRERFSGLFRRGHGGEFFRLQGAVAVPVEAGQEPAPDGAGGRRRSSRYGCRHRLYSFCVRTPVAMQVPRQRR